MKSKKRKPLFVLIIPRFEDFLHSYYTGEIIKGASFAASRLSIDLLIHIVDRSDHRGWLDSTLLDLQYVDGILFADIDNDVNVVKKVIRSGMPCIVLNNSLKEPINWIAVDNKKATLDVVNYLIKLGHTKIATITGDLSTQAGLMRLEGYKKALQKNHLKVSKSRIVEGEFLRTPARKGAERLLKSSNRPTAIFAASDVMALEAIDVAKSYKIRIPEDLSVIGFDDNPLCKHNPVGLSTVAQPLLEMGRLGIETLHQIARGKAQLPVKKMLSAQMVIRGSTQILKR